MRLLSRRQFRQSVSGLLVLVGRRLIIFDSFEGLPEPAEYDRSHYAVHVGHTDRYRKGMFAASLDAVKQNPGVTAIQVCVISALVFLTERWATLKGMS